MLKLLGAEELIELNKKLGGNVLNRGLLEFLASKIEIKHKDKDAKRQIAKIAAILWMDIIQTHPFMDANKRTATEGMLLFLQKNHCVLETTIAGKVYMALKIANNEMAYENLVDWLYEKIKELK